MKALFAMFTLAGLMTFAGCASMGSVPVSYAGGVLVNAGGMTVYTFDKDPAGSGKSVCNGNCATNWPLIRSMVAGPAPL